MFSILKMIKKKYNAGRVRTHEAGIYVQHITGRNLTVPEAIVVESGCLGYLKLFYGEPSQTI